MRVFMIPLALTLGVAAHPAAGKNRSSFLKPNKLHEEDQLHRFDANLDEKGFRQLIDQVLRVYRPLAQRHGATLQAEIDWQDPTVNAFADQDEDGTLWTVSLLGGLARRPEVSADAYTLVLCHEMGHHFAGYPFYDESWASSEGQSDYFSTQSCAHLIWQDQTAENERQRRAAPLDVRLACNAVWQDASKQNLCYRSIMAAQSLAHLDAVMEPSTLPQLATPDPNLVSSTYTSHPQAQCRFDTHVAGALCQAQDETQQHTIPGRHHPDGQGSVGAELAANNSSCFETAGFGVGNRPRCWFAPAQRLAIDQNQIKLEETRGRGNGAPDPNDVLVLTTPITNHHPVPIGGAIARIVLHSPAISLLGVDSTRLLPRLAPGQTAYPDAAFRFQVAADAPCGTPLGMQLQLETNLGIDTHDFHWVACRRERESFSREKLF